MDDERKTKAELIAELRSLRREVSAVTDAELHGPEVQPYELSHAVEVFRHLLETMGAMVVRLDAQGRVLAIGPTVEPVLGFKPKELFRSSALELVDPGDRERVQRSYRELLRTGSCAPFRMRVRRPDDSLAHLEFSAVAQPDEAEGPQVTALARDVTDEALARQAVAESEKRHRILAEASRDLLTETVDERFVFLSSTCHEVLGYEVNELIGKRSRDLFHPEDIDRIEAEFLGSTDEGMLTYRNFRMRHKTGGWRWYEGTSVQYERPDGTQSTIGTLRDVTERHLAKEEAELMQERVQLAQKLETLGIMAGGIAHDFGNLLTPILGHASLAVQDVPSESPAKARLEKIRSAAQRAAALTNQMLAYAGGEPLKLDRVDLSGLVGEVRDVLSNTIPERARVRVDLAPDLPAARADGAQVMQVVMNLITNAAEAIDAERGGISIRTGRSTGSELQRQHLVVGEPDLDEPYVWVAVTDTGSGLDPATRERIFDPFYTTKFTGRGLGLAAVLGIVRAHAGCIELRSKPGRGTRFRVFFRAYDTPGEFSMAEPPPTSTAHGVARTVVVADDDEGARELFCEALSRAGIEVIPARDGREAVATVLDRLDRGDAVDAVVMDRTMPELDGLSALERIRRRAPELPAVLVSGYADARREAPLPSSVVLEKPFVPEVLVRALEHVLNEETSECAEV